MKKRWIAVLTCCLLILAAGTALAEGVLELPGNLTRLDESAFEGVVSANTAIVPAGVTEIAARTFADGGFVEIRLPATVTKIGAEAFRDCGPDGVKRYYIAPAGLTAGADAFKGCTATIMLGDVELPYLIYTVNDGSVTITGMGGDIAELAIPATIEGLPVTAIGSDAFKDNATLTGVTIPEGVTAIGHSAFRSCAALTDVTFPDSLRTIEAYAFNGCGSDAEAGFTFVLPDSLTNVVYAGYSEGSFRNCNAVLECTPDSDTAYLMSDQLYQITFDGQHDFRYQYRTVDDARALYLTGYVGAGGDVAIPEGPAVIDSDVFKENATLTGVTIPEGVTTIGNSAFYRCPNLERVTMADTVTTVMSNAFQYDAKLTDVTFSANLTAVKGDAFSNTCTVEGIYRYNLPDGLTECDSYSFRNCGAVLCVARNSATEGLIRAAQYTYTRYGETDYRYRWYNNEGERLMQYLGTAASAVEIPAGIWLIDDNAFKEHAEIESVVIPTGVTKIGHDVFRDCVNLTDVTFPDSLLIIESGAFAGCGSEAEETGFVFALPDGLTGVYGGNAGGTNAAFYNCPAILTCGIDSTTAMALSDRYYSYARNDRPDEMDFRYRCGYIAGNVKVPRLFDYAGTATRVRLPDDCEYADSEKFRNRTDLTLICAQLSDTDAALSAVELNHTFPGHEDFLYRVIDGVLYVTGWTGSGSAIEIPEATAYIAEGWDEQIRSGAFQNKATVTRAVIPEGVTRINANAFEGCVALTDITLPGSLKSMDQKAFRYCGQNEEAPFYLVLPDSMEDLAGRNGGANTFEDFHGILVCGKTSATAALLTDRNYVYTCPGEYDYRYRYESYTEGDVTGRRLWLVGYVGEGAQSSIPSGIYGIKSFDNNTTDTNWRTFYGDAFKGNATLTKVVVPEGTVRINDCAFEGCVNLTDITLPDSLTSMGDKVFRYCGQNATSDFYVFLPDNIDTIIGNGGGANTFEDFYDYHSMARENDQNHATLVCKKQSTTAYTLSDGNYSFAIQGHHDDGLIYRYENRAIEGENNGEAMYRLFVYDYVGDATEVTIPDDIGVYGVARTPPGGSDTWHPAFMNVKTLHRIVIPEGVAVISPSAFANCTALTDITLPSTLKRIMERAFENTGHTGQRFIVVIPAGVEEFFAGAFQSFGDSGATLVALGAFVRETLYDNDWQYYQTLSDAEVPRNLIRRPHDDPDFKWFGHP